MIEDSRFGSLERDRSKKTLLVTGITGSAAIAVTESRLGAGLSVPVFKRNFCKTTSVLLVVLDISSWCDCSNGTFSSYPNL